MTIRSRSEFKADGRSIDLTGPGGNAYSLLSLTKNLAKRLGKDEDDILGRMKSGDYENLIKVFDEEFGDIITLYR